MKWWIEIKAWWCRLNKYTWCVDIRCNAELYFKLFLELERGLINTFPDMPLSQLRALREIERDWKITVARAKYLERFVKGSKEIDFDKIRCEILEKMSIIADKVESVKNALKEREQNV